MTAHLLLGWGADDHEPVAQVLSGLATEGVFGDGRAGQGGDVVAFVVEVLHDVGQGGPVRLLG